MDFAFIYPPAWAPWAPSYALGLLTAAVRRHGHRPLCIDVNIKLHNQIPVEDRVLWNDQNGTFWMDRANIKEMIDKHRSFIDGLVDQVVSFNVKLCAFSINSASRLFALEFAELLKARDKDIYILFGGPDCFRAEAGLSVLDHPAVDAICTGEGDFALSDFLDKFEANGRPIAPINGFCIKTPDGAILDGGDPPIIMDMDSLSDADYSDFPLSEYSLQNRVCLMMSRGCILRCAYCSEGANFLRYRYRSARRLFEEVRNKVAFIKTYAPNQTPFINFSDSLINGRPEILDAFCDLIIENGVVFEWGGMALIRKEMTPELLRKMARAGCREIMWGLESGSGKTLSLMRKKLFTPELASQVIRAASRAGITQFTNIIVGFPGETEDQFLETVLFVEKHARYFHHIGLPLMTIRRNSHVFDNYSAYGVDDPAASVDWKSDDGANTRELRNLRRRVLATVVGGRLFHQGKYEDDQGFGGDDPFEGTLEEQEKKALSQIISHIGERETLSGDDKRILEGWIELCTEEKVEGWVWAPDFPEARIPLSVWVGNRLAGTVIAESPRRDLVTAGKGDGRYGFSFDLSMLPRYARNGAVTVRVGGTKCTI
jgi:anaerobic magnesium-protoporphyrin IX monomethyl ester cyclase